MNPLNFTITCHGIFIQEYVFIVLCIVNLYPSFLDLSVTGRINRDTCVDFKLVSCLDQILFSEFLWPISEIG